MKHRSRTRVGYSNCTVVKYLVENGTMINNEKNQIKKLLIIACERKIVKKL